MPALNGPELVEQLRELRPTTKFVLMTGYGDADEDRRRADAMQVPVLGKPFSGPELVDVVRSAIADDAADRHGR